MTQRSARWRTPADIGLTLQQARLDRGLSQTELAEELELPQSTISEMESGTSTIYLRRLLEMVRSLGIELHVTWTDDDAPRR